MDIKRNVTELNDYVNERITVRTYMEDGSFLRADVFIDGQRVGIYKETTCHPAAQFEGHILCAHKEN